MKPAKSMPALGKERYRRSGQIQDTTGDHLMKAVIALRGQVSGRARGHALADGATVEDDHIPIRFNELIGHRHAGNARTDDDNVRTVLFYRHGFFIEYLRAHPEGNALFFADIHANARDELALSVNRLLESQHPRTGFVPRLPSSACEGEQGGVRIIPLADETGHDLSCNHAEGKPVAAIAEDGVAICHPGYAADRG